MLAAVGGGGKVGPGCILLTSATPPLPPPLTVPPASHPAG